MNPKFSFSSWRNKLAQHDYKTDKYVVKAVYAMDWIHNRILFIVNTFQFINDYC